MTQAMTPSTELSSEYLELVPRDKGLEADKVRQLAERGEPETYTGEALQHVGMPVGGLCCGTLYLSGDGRLWVWDIFNESKKGVFPEGTEYKGKHLAPMNGSAYVAPPKAKDRREIEQRFEISIKSSNGEWVRTLDADPETGFKEVSFTGQYPVGTVRYSDPDLPVVVELKAYSPFIPLNADDSSLPATVLQFSIENQSKNRLEVTLCGFLENAVMHLNEDGLVRRQMKTIVEDKLTYLHGTAEVELPAKPTGRPDIVFEDWSAQTYEASGWTVEGEAFGTGPIDQDEAPIHHGVMGGDNPRVLNTSATSPGTTMREHDLAHGKIRSRRFVIERPYINTWVSGGQYLGTLGVHVLVDGQVVRQITGVCNNRLLPRTIDVADFIGQEATLEIVDHEDRGWGWIGLGRIWFSDEMVDAERIESRGDYGNMGLALLGAPAEVQVEDASAEPGEKLVGSLGRKLSLEPGQSESVDFAVTWYFPNIPYLLDGKLRHYTRNFTDAHSVACYLAKHFERLSTQTLLWRDTWNDSTLPHWFLNRTFANLSLLATTTSHRFDDGRFWAWEGVGTCDGTCAHVWHYAQGLSRIFPEIERNHREHIDFDQAIQANGVIQNRSNFRNPRETGENQFCVDGQIGRILGAYREHQMSADTAFLPRVWPKVKLAIQFLISRDEQRNGILKGPMHNTLDADWYGVVPWFCGLYHAALKAGTVMAEEMEDPEFKKECEAILAVASETLDAKCWREEFGYYVQLPDPEHPGEVGVYDGCHIDQVFGESWLRQIGLQGAMTEDKVRSALRSLWEYNFTPDVGPYRAARTKGRWYATEGDAGMLMVTYPYGDNYEVAEGKGGTMGYFNECMSGFEHQVAGHMIWEGMVHEGLAVEHAIHQRYSAENRNPYNEIECSDHYARSMASYGAFIAACGYEHHNPKGHLGFAPRLSPENFRASFTAAEGWGTYAQRFENNTLSVSLKLNYGKLDLHTLSLEWPEQSMPASGLTLSLEGATVETAGRRIVIRFSEPVTFEAGVLWELSLSPEA